MSPNHEECHLNTFMNSFHNEKEEYEGPPTKILDSSRSWTDVSVLDGMCSSSRPQRDGCVYKRRKCHKNSHSTLPEENVAEIAKIKLALDSCTSSENYLFEAQKDDVEITAVAVLTTDVESLPNGGLDGICPIGEFEELDKASDGKSSKSALERCHNINDRCSSSKSNVELSSTFFKMETDDIGECSSSDALEIAELDSARDVCIYVLKSHGLLVKSCAISRSALKISYDKNSKLSQKCKTCGLLDNPLKMLICDLCDEAYHLSCCIPRVKNLPVDEWFCQPCFVKKPKPLISKTPEKSSNDTNRSSHRSYSIPFMLGDSKPYTTGVRIGRDFQAEVQEWSGPVSSEDDYFDELTEMDSTEPVNLNELDGRKSQKPSSIGNWIQCREVLHSNGSDEGNICGKWRRAPLFVVQSEDWDCSCCVLWDPIHADCSVPQELETEEVLKHLKFVKWKKRATTSPNCGSKQQLEETDSLIGATDWNGRWWPKFDPTQTLQLRPRLMGQS